MHTNVRVRFAPSPTGFLHIGNARTALYNWLYARATGGTFILRIDDTDQKRSTKEAVDMAIRSLTWLGLDWDEGPGIGGNYGPYYQSERLPLYRNHIETLLTEGKAYYCFCSSEELDMKSAAQKTLGQLQTYDGKCKRIPYEEAKQRVLAGEKARVRFATPDGPVIFNDLARGNIRREGKEIGDFVIFKDDGFPTYNFATVIDEALMRITHVIRGEDHISNTPRQKVIFEAFGYDIPQYVHTSMIMGADREKLSKRHGASTLMDLREMGYLPEAVRNFLALLGWSHPEGVETMPTEEIIRVFDLSRFSKSAAIFDEAKFRHINAWHIKNGELDYITKQCIPFLIKGGYLAEEYSTEDFEYAKRLVAVLRDYCSELSEINEHVGVFFNDEFILTESMQKELATERAKALLAFIKNELAPLERVTVEAAKAMLHKAQTDLGVKGKALYHPIRIAVTGQESGADLTHIFDLLGKERLLKRLSRVG